MTNRQDRDPSPNGASTVNDQHTHNKHINPYDTVCTCSAIIPTYHFSRTAAVLRSALQPVRSYARISRFNVPRCTELCWVSKFSAPFLNCGFRHRKRSPYLFLSFISRSQLFGVCVCVCVRACVRVCGWVGGQVSACMYQPQETAFEHVCQVRHD